MHQPDLTCKYGDGDSELSLRTGDHGIHDSAVVVTFEGTYDNAASEATSSQANDIEMAYLEYDDINAAIDSQPNPFCSHLLVVVETINANGPDEEHRQNVRTVPCENKPDDVVQVSLDEMGSIKPQHKTKDSHDDDDSNLVNIWNIVAPTLTRDPQVDPRAVHTSTHAKIATQSTMTALAIGFFKQDEAVDESVPKS